MLQEPGSASDQPISDIVERDGGVITVCGVSTSVSGVGIPQPVITPTDPFFGSRTCRSESTRRTKVLSGQGPTSPFGDPVRYFDSPFDAGAPRRCGCAQLVTSTDFPSGHDQTALNDRVRQIGTDAEFLDWFDLVRRQQAPPLLAARSDPRAWAADPNPTGVTDPQVQHATPARNIRGEPDSTGRLRTGGAAA